MTIQGWTPKILTLSINQGTKFGTLKKPMFSLFDVINFWFRTLKKPMFSLFDVINFWFNGIKQNICGTTSSEQYLK